MNIRNYSNGSLGLALGVFPIIIIIIVIEVVSCDFILTVWNDAGWIISDFSSCSLEV